MHARRISALVIAAIAVVRCDGGGETKPLNTVSVRDSAGVTITTHTNGHIEQLPVTTLTEPDVSIGTLEGEPGQQLYQVRGATRLADGTIIVLNGGTHEVRIYDAEGGFVDAIGRQGGGPGEFMLPILLRRTAADTVAVYDLAERRLTFIGFDVADDTLDEPGITGAVARTLNAPRQLSGLTGLLDSTRVLLAAPPRVDSEGLVDLPVDVTVLDLETGATDTIGSFGRRQEVRTVQGEIIIAVDVPYTVFPTVRAHDGSIFVVDGVSPDVRVYGSDGRLERIMRLDRLARPVSRSTFDDYVEQRIARSRELMGGGETRGLPADEARRLYESMSLPEMQPFYDALIVAGNGDVWLREFELRPEGYHDWTVLDQTGRPTARFRVPVGLAVREAGADYVLGVSLDEYDVEYVQLYRFGEDR